ncbi:MAG TPA: hypothetical protein VF541_16140 [Longimicrobium sp.]|jgi:hypothetical protein
MSLQEIEAEALKLPEPERAKLARRLLASLGETAEVDDPILSLGSAPVICDVPDGSAEHDRHLYGSALR